MGRDFASERASAASLKGCQHDQRTSLDKGNVEVRTSLDCANKSAVDDASLHIASENIKLKDFPDSDDETVGPRSSGNALTYRSSIESVYSSSWTRISDASACASSPSSTETCQISRALSEGTRCCL